MPISEVWMALSMDEMLRGRMFHTECANTLLLMCRGVKYLLERRSSLLYGNLDVSHVHK